MSDITTDLFNSLRTKISGDVDPYLALPCRDLNFNGSVRPKIDDSPKRPGFLIQLKGWEIVPSMTDCGAFEVKGRRGRDCYFHRYLSLFIEVYQFVGLLQFKILIEHLGGSRQIEI